MNDTDLQLQILEEIKHERERQDKKFGTRNDYPPYRWITILVEEVGEVSNAILEEDLANYQRELIQVAAVAVAALENTRRKLLEKQNEEISK